LQTLLPVVALALFFRLIGRTADTIEIIIAAIGLLRVVGAAYTFFTLRYGLNEGALHIHRGVVFQQKRTIPLERIQNINLTRDWIHQLLGVVEVKVETASGVGAEATLSALSSEDANRLREQLLLVKSGLVATPDMPGAASDSPVQVPVEVVYQADIRRLILAGATRNQVGTIIAGISAAAFTLWELLDESAGLFRRTPDAISWAKSHLGWLLLSAAGLWVAGWIFSMIRSVVVHYEFRLTREGTRLRRTFGLFTRRESDFPVHRLQMLVFESPLIQRKLGYGRLVAETAGSFSEKREETTSELAPLLEAVRLSDVTRHLVGPTDLRNPGWQKVSRLTIRRAFVRYLFAWLLAVAFLSMTVSRHVAWAAAFAPIFAVWGSLLRFRALRYALCDDLLLLRRGVLRRRISAVPRRKVQSAALTQSPFQRRLGISSLRIQVAGDFFGSELVIPDLPNQRAVELLDEVSGRHPTRLSPTLPSPNHLTI
jgi:putative membrane protein